MIGSWRRVAQHAMDLLMFYRPDKCRITYYISNDSTGYKIEFPFALIKDITLENGESQPAANGTPPRPGGLLSTRYRSEMRRLRRSTYDRG